VTVNAVNDTPTLNNPIDDVTVDEDASDTVIDMSGVFDDAEDGGGLTLSIQGNTNAALVGTSLVGTNLTLSYAPNQIGTSDITIRATDSGGAFVEHTFTVTVNAVNDTPTLNNPIDDVTVDEDASDTIIDLSAVFNDVEDGGGLTLSIQNNTNAGLVDASLVGTDLTLSYALNQSGTADITVRATDSGGAFVEHTFTVTVNAINDTPTLDNPVDDVTVDEDASDTVIDLSGVFGDIDVGDNLTLTVSGNTNAGLVGANLIGTDLTLSYAPDASGAGDITIRATDSGGAWVEDTFTIMVNAVNDTPTVMTAVDDVTVDENAADTVIDLSNVFDDIDIGDSLTLTVSGNTAPGLVGANLVGTDLTLSFTADSSGTADITIRATDAGGAWVEDTFNVIVNTTPAVVGPIDDLAVDEDAADTVIDLSGVFDDFEDGGALTLTVSGNTDSSLVTTNLVGSQLTLSYIPNANGASEITIRAIDSGGAWIEDTFTVTVNPVNDTPIVTNPIVRVMVDQGVSDSVIDLSGVFGDPDIGDSVTFLVAGNSNLELVGTTMVGTNLTLSYAAGEIGAAEITVRATDSQGFWIEDTFTATVYPQAPSNDSEPESDDMFDLLSPVEQSIMESLSYDIAFEAPIAIEAFIPSVDLLSESTPGGGSVSVRNPAIAAGPAATAVERDATNGSSDTPTKAATVDMLTEPTLVNKDASAEKTDNVEAPAPTPEQIASSKSTNTPEAATEDILAAASEGANGNGAQAVEPAEGGVTQQDEQFELFAARSDMPEPSSTSSDALDQETGSHNVALSVVAGTAAATAIASCLVWLRRSSSRAASLLSHMQKSLPFQTSGDPGLRRRRPKSAGKSRKAGTAARTLRDSNSHSTRV